MSIVSLYSYQLVVSRQQIKICLCHFANMFFLQIRQRYIFMFDKSIRAIAAILVNDADQ